MVIVRSFCRLRRVVSSNSNERVSYEISVGRRTPPEAAMSAYDPKWTFGEGPGVRCDRWGPLLHPAGIRAEPI